MNSDSLYLNIAKKISSEIGNNDLKNYQFIKEINDDKLRFASADQIIEISDNDPQFAASRMMELEKKLSKIDIDTIKEDVQRVVSSAFGLTSDKAGLFVNDFVSFAKTLKELNINEQNFEEKTSEYFLNLQLPILRKSEDLRNSDFKNADCSLLLGQYSDEAIHSGYDVVKNSVFAFYTKEKAKEIYPTNVNKNQYK